MRYWVIRIKIKLMKYLLSEELRKKYPHSIFAFSIIKNIKVFGPDNISNKILTDIYPAVLAKYYPDTLFTHPSSIAYSNFAAAIGVY